MKKIILMLAAVLMLGACGSNDSKKDAKTSPESTTISMKDMVEVVINVEGMTCEGCENAVKKSIASLDGVGEVSASHTDCNAVVKYDASKTTPEAIEEKIKDAGYTVVKDI
jgi:copper chaperone CopZ